MDNDNNETNANATLNIEGTPTGTFPLLRLHKPAIMATSGQSYSFMRAGRTGLAVGWQKSGPNARSAGAIFENVPAGGGTARILNLRAPQSFLPLLVRMHPFVPCDRLPLGELDHVHGWA